MREAVHREGGVAGTDNLFLLRTACVSSAPPESSHTARAAMSGQFSRHGNPIPGDGERRRSCLSIVRPVPLSNDNLRPGWQRLGYDRLEYCAHDFAFRLTACIPIPLPARNLPQN